MDEVDRMESDFEDPKMLSQCLTFLNEIGFKRCAEYMHGQKLLGKSIWGKGLDQYITDDLKEMCPTCRTTALMNLIQIQNDLILRIAERHNSDE